MTKLIHRFETRATPEALWAGLSDLELVQATNPTVVTARVDRPAGKGATRTCTLKPKGEVVERVTVWEPGKAVGLEVAKSDWPITHMNWVTRIEPGPRGAVLSQELNYGMKFGPLGWLLNALVMKRNVDKNVALALQGLIKWAEAKS
jgi:Polyketide cyclase / dehydrase and lipid transport